MTAIDLTRPCPICGKPLTAATVSFYSYETREWTQLDTGTDQHLAEHVDAAVDA